MNLLEIVRAQRAATQAELDALLETPSAENRAAFTEAEEARFTELRGTLIAQDARIAELVDLEARNEAAAAGRKEIGLQTGGAKVRSPRTYAKGAPHSYFQDLARSAVLNDLAASQRLARWAQECEVEARENPDGYEARTLQVAQAQLAEEQRTGLTTTTGSGGTFTPPEYLVDQYVPVARPARPFADAVSKFELPKGTMSINLPKVLTGTVVASQSSQNTNVNETDLTDAFISASVVTKAGQQTVALQLLEQSAVAFDEIVMKDLSADLAVRVDSDVITATLAVSGIAAETYTDGTPTAAKLLNYIAKALADVQSNRYLPATGIFMTPARWWWLSSGGDSSGRPLVTPNGVAMNAFGTWEEIAAYGGPVGNIFGTPVFTDPSLPTNLGAGTNQDIIVIAKLDDIYLWESPITARALPQTLGNQLSVLLQVYEYEAVMANRYASAIATVGGTGLVTPAWTAH